MHEWSHRLRLVIGGSRGSGFGLLYKSLQNDRSGSPLMSVSPPPFMKSSESATDLTPYGINLPHVYRIRSLAHYLTNNMGGSETGACGIY